MSAARDPNRTTVARPAAARVVASPRWDSTRIELDDPADLMLVPGELVQVFALPAAGHRAAIAGATAISARTIEVEHPFGTVGRRCWVRRPT